ncbi:MAG: hypothetical protein H8F28_21265 [Fibrella sp.]|nr:hypothetical protein [Armatimonadota bacterium]
MRSIETNRRVFLSMTFSAIAGGAIAGCGAFKNAVNDRIPPIANPGNLDGVQFPVPVTSGATRVPVDGTGSYTGQFSDVAPVGQQNRLTFAEFTQNLRGEIAFVPGGATALPSRIVLNDISLTVTLSDGSGVVPVPTREVRILPLRSASGNLVFERVGDTNRYQWTQSGEIRLGSVRVSGDDARRLFALLTEADNNRQNTNTVTAVLSVGAAFDGVENVSGAILFTFGKGEARVGI